MPSSFRGSMGIIVQYDTLGRNNRHLAEVSTQDIKQMHSERTKVFLRCRLLSSALFVQQYWCSCVTTGSPRWSGRRTEGVWRLERS